MNSTKTYIALMLFLALLHSTSMGQLADDSRWDYRFGLPGAQGSVMAVAFDKKQIFLGGFIQSVGDLAVDGVAEFDGKRWQTLPDGPQQAPGYYNVFALELFKGRLYAGGFFTNVGGQSAGGFACWQGNKWSVPGITTGMVNALQADEQGVLVGGRFCLPGWTNPVALARFDGHKHWEVLNSEIPPPTEEDLVAIDSITTFKTLPNGDIAGLLSLQIRNWWGGWTGPYYMLFRCDRNYQWFNVPGPDSDPSGLGYYVLTTFAGNLIAGGAFTNATTPSIRNVARWDGAGWQTLGQGLDGEVVAVAGNERVLYAWHQVGIDGRARTWGVSRWDGVHWARLGTNIFQNADAWGRLFLGPNDELYAGGFFTGIGSVVAPGVVRWNGSSWESLFSGANEGVAGGVNLVMSLVEHQGTIYMGGSFASAGSVLSPGVARWDGTRWQDVGGGILGLPSRYVRTMASSGELLFAGGAFTNIGGAEAMHIASWDGTAWNALGTGTTGTVNALAWYKGSLYMGGRFQMAGGIEANNIAYWDGFAWQPAGGGCNGTVNTLATWRDRLYVGGAFDSAGGNPAMRLASWDGARWREEGAGVWGMTTSSVTRLAVVQDALYVGGSFSRAGTMPAHNIARWDGTNWQRLGEGWPGSVLALAGQGNSLYVGGRWTNSLGQTTHAILRWDGANWFELGSGLQEPHIKPQVSALLATPDALWVGGRFCYAGGKPSANIARWVERPRIKLGHRPGKSQEASPLHLTADPGLHVQIEISDDLRTWTPLLLPDDAPVELDLDVAPRSRARFHRAVLKP